MPEKIETHTDRSIAACEAEIVRAARNAGIPLVRITVEDRMRGAIIEAMIEIERGRPLKAWCLLDDVLKL